MLWRAFVERNSKFHNEMLLLGQAYHLLNSTAQLAYFVDCLNHYFPIVKNIVIQCCSWKPFLRIEHGALFLSEKHAQITSNKVACLNSNSSALLHIRKHKQSIAIIRFQIFLTNCVKAVDNIREAKYLVLMAHKFYSNWLPSD